MKDISKIKISETEKLRENIQLLQKEIKSLFLTIFKNQEENKESSNSESSGSLDSSQTNESDSANPKLLWNKLNIVYELAEKSYFEMDTALAIVSRLKGIKKIHEDSPNIQQNINAISKSSSTINELNLKVKQSVESMKIDIDKEFNLIFKELTEWEKDIASL